MNTNATLSKKVAELEETQHKHITSGRELEVNNYQLTSENAALHQRVNLLKAEGQKVEEELRITKVQITDSDMENAKVIAEKNELSKRLRNIGTHNRASRGKPSA